MFYIFLFAFPFIAVSCYFFIRKVIVGNQTEKECEETSLKEKVISSVEYHLEFDCPDWYSTKEYYNDIYALEDAKIIAKAHLHVQCIKKVRIFEGDNLVETVDSPYPEGMSCLSPMYDEIRAKCFLPDSLLSWAKLVNIDSDNGSSEDGRDIWVFEVEEDESNSDMQQYDKSYLTPAMVYEFEVIKNIGCKLLLKRRVWEDNRGKKHMAEHKVSIFGLTKTYFSETDNSVSYQKEFSNSSVSSTAALIAAYEAFTLFKNHAQSHGQRSGYSGGIVTSDVYADENYVFKPTNECDAWERESWLYDLDSSSSSDPWGSDSDSDGDW